MRILVHDYEYKDEFLTDRCKNAYVEHECELCNVLEKLPIQQAKIFLNIGFRNFCMENPEVKVKSTLN